MMSTDKWKYVLTRELNEKTESVDLGFAGTIQYD